MNFFKRKPKIEEPQKVTKALEYAKLQAILPPSISFGEGNDRMRFEVNYRGELITRDSLRYLHLEPETAIQLANWILETFQ